MLLGLLCSSLVLYFLLHIHRPIILKEKFIHSFKPFGSSIGKKYSTLKKEFSLAMKGIPLLRV